MTFTVIEVFVPLDPPVNHAQNVARVSLPQIHSERCEGCEQKQPFIPRQAAVRNTLYYICDGNIEDANYSPSTADYFHTNRKLYWG